MSSIVTRLIYDNKTLAPIPGVFPSEENTSLNIRPYVMPEERGYIGYATHNKKTFEDSMAIYEVINGIPILLKVLKMQGTNGVFAKDDDLQPLVNWATGILERASTGDMTSGGWYIPQDVLAKKIEQPRHYSLKGKPYRPDPKLIQRDWMYKCFVHKKCVDIAKLLIPAKAGSTTKFEILKVDEDGSPGALSDFAIEANKLRQILTIRLQRSLIAYNKELMDTWHRVVERGVKISQIHDAESAAPAIEAMKVEMQEMLTAHCHLHWMAQDGVSFRNDYCERMNAICTKIVNFIPSLVKDVETVHLKLVSIPETEVPLFIGIQGSPVSVGEQQLPDNFRFPKTFTTSPFELIGIDEKQEHIKKMSRPTRVKVLFKTPEPKVQTPEQAPVKEHATTGGNTIKSFQELPSLD